MGIADFDIKLLEIGRPSFRLLVLEERCEGRHTEPLPVLFYVALPVVSLNVASAEITSRSCRT